MKNAPGAVFFNWRNSQLTQALVLCGDGVLYLIAGSGERGVALHFVDDVFPLGIHLVEMADAGAVAFKVAQYFTEDENLVLVFNTIVLEQELALGSHESP